MILTNSSTYPIGLDISDLSVKLVQLNKIRGKIKIQAIGKLDLPKNIVLNGEIKNRPELIKAVKKIISTPLSGKVSSEEVVACLPESKTFIKLIEVQKSPNSLSDTIGLEIEKHIPLSLSEIYYDWQMIDEQPDKYQVLIGAAPKEIVNQYTEMLDQAGLSPVALEIEPEAIARCLIKEEAYGSKLPIAKSKTDKAAGLNYGIIDIGANHTCLIFYAGNTILFTVSIPISGEEITAKIAQTLKLTMEQAEKAKIICGLDDHKANGVIKDILADTLKNLLEKIKAAMAYYENYFSQYGPLDQILLCGGGANIPDLPRIIGQQFSLEVKLADALTNLDEPRGDFDEIFTEKHFLNLKNANIKSGGKENSLSIRQNASATFATAFGLALRGIFIDEL